MACFAAPATAAIVIAAAKNKIPKKYHPEWLLAMLGGGTLMLIVDHIASGEIVAYYPFLTASWSAIWPEILRVGVPMTIAVFICWGVMVGVAGFIRRTRCRDTEMSR
ncbi:MAG: hypothetical protein V1838_04075 [Patescibacteria group bacterium]